MAQSLDIEHLCRWAYREELSKRRTSSAEAIWGRLADFSATAAAIDYSPGPQRYDLGEPHADAVLLEAAVAKLPDVALDWQSEAGMILGDLLALVEPRHLEGAPAPSPGRVTNISWGNFQQTQQVQPARQVILVRTLRPAALVTAHAYLGTRPDWHTDPPRPQSVPSTRGHGPKIVGECKARNWYTTGSYCPLVWEPSAIEVAEARADYLAWWRGLVRLVKLLRGQLTRFAPLMPAAPEMPWRELP